MSDPNNPWATPAPSQQPDPRFGSLPAPAPPYAPSQPSAAAQPYAPTQPYAPPQPYGQAPNPYAYAPAPYRFRGNQGLGTALLILGGVLVTALVLRALSAPAAMHAEDAAWAQGIDPRTVTTAHGVLGGLFVVVLPIWIVGSLWISRAHANASALARPHLRRSAVWCWLAWIVPVVSWWFPKQLVDDTWRITAHQLPPGSSGRYQPTGWWWGLWVAASLFLGSEDRQGVWVSAGTLPDRHPGVHPVIDVVAAVLAIAAYAFWIPVVLGLSRAQEELARRFAPAPWG